MKYNLNLCVLAGCLALLAPVGALAQNKNNISVWGMGGYSALFATDSHLHAAGKFGGGLGVGYEFHHKRFMFQTGAEFNYHASGLKLDDFTFDKEGLLDTEGEGYTGHYRFSQSVDHYQYGYVNIPFLLGMRMGKTYFLAGAKVGLNVLASSTVESAITASATYDRFIEDFENMPNHNLGTTFREDDYAIGLGLNCAVSAEVGLYLGSAEKQKKNAPQYRLALFADYGVLDINTARTVENLVLESMTANNYQPYLNNFMKSHDMGVNAFCVGLKFTVSFGIEGRRDCRCDYYDTINRRRK